VTDVRVELIEAGIQAFLRSDVLKKDLERRARNIAQAAGANLPSRGAGGRFVSNGGMAYEVVEGDDGRWRAAIWTDSFAAKAAEANDHALTRAIDAGRA
jgi:hypothetical protein